MNKEQFWNIVNEVHSSTDPRNQKEVLTALRDRLRNLPSEEILEWKQIFSFYQDAARRNDLWAASAAMGAHSSDDGFMDFRSWLISQGRDVYMSALEDPESLVERYVVIPSCVHAGSFPVSRSRRKCIVSCNQSIGRATVTMPPCFS